MQEGVYGMCLPNSRMEISIQELSLERNQNMFSRQYTILFRSLILVLAASGAVWAQESRGSITGSVTDPQGAPVPGATVTITNTDTNVPNRVSSNQTGYFEANLLNPGQYSVTVEAQGFKKTVQSGIGLSVSERLAINLQLEIGAMNQSVEVTAEAPLLDTTSASGSRLIDTKELSSLPFPNMNPLTLQAMAPGMIQTAAFEDSRWFDHAGTSNYASMGVGAQQQEFLLDGAPTTGTAGRAGFVPATEAVDEFRLETMPLDASYGHTQGAVVSLVSKSGTNSYHGTLVEQHYQQKWKALQHFSRLQQQAEIAAGTRKPGDPRLPPGHYNQFGAAVGGPVRIPHVFNGKNKLFFFLDYTKLISRLKEVTGINYTVPTATQRLGDFSDLLKVPDPSAATKYTIYDPRSAQSVGGRVVRTPFPGNKGIPVLDPMYNFMVKLYPLPNNVPGLVTPEGANNLYADYQPKNDTGANVTNRYDWNITDRHRVNGKWYWDDRHSSEYDWAYNTPLRGYVSNALLRYAKGMSSDYIFSINSANMLNIGFNVTRYNAGSGDPMKLAYKPSDLGLPKYVDQQAGPYTMIPNFSVSGYAAGVSDSTAYPGTNEHSTTGELKAQMTTIRGAHSLKYGYSERRYQWAGNGAGTASGSYSFNNSYFMASDNATGASSLGLAWAAFMMGVGNPSIPTNAQSIFSTRYRALYLQDDWRITRKLRIGLGLRYEREGGTTERFNRAIVQGWDPNYRPAYAGLVEAAYAKNPIPEMPASQFKVAGGSYYMGVNYNGVKYDNASDGTHHFLPNVSVVYELNKKTVVRAGYGVFYGTTNANNSRPSQTGFSRTTSTTLSNDRGLTFCCSIGAAGNITAAVNSMTDPFPLRADGTRFDVPTGNTLGQDYTDGGSPSTRRDTSPPKQQRWRLSIQREIAKDMVLDVSYNGAYSTSQGSYTLSYLPQQYWSTGNVRNDANYQYLTTTFPNPFNIANLASIQSTNPILYQWASTQGKFTGTTVQRSALLRAWPNFSSVNGIPAGEDPSAYNNHTKYRDLEIQFERRFSKGLRSVVSFTNATSDSTYRQNEFEKFYSWQDNGNARPYRVSWTFIYELPYGKGRKWGTNSPLRHVLGGWQLSWVYVRQAGTRTGWGNLFFYGDINQIDKLFNHDEVWSKDIHQWFDPNIRYTASGACGVPSGFTGFEGRTACQPVGNHVRVFPTQLDLRNPELRNWDAKLAREFRFTERVRFNFSADALDATNHTNFNGPNLDPTSTSFGRITSQAGVNRLVQLNGRFEF